MKRQIRYSAFAVLVLLLLSLHGLPAQESGIAVNGSGITVDFGTPLDTAWQGDLYLQSGARMQARNLEVAATAGGTILFYQGEALLANPHPRSEDNLVALAHEDGFVTLYSSPTLIPKDFRTSKNVTKGAILGTISAVKDSGSASYYLRIADGKSGLLVNPALFATTLIDRAAPKVEEVYLMGNSSRIKAEPGRRVLQRFPQGDYRLAIKVSDPSYAAGVVSGLFRIKAVLDGQVVADRKLDSAKSMDEGLGFLGLDAPSSQIVDRDMRLLLGSRFLPRGNHSLELTAYDFNNNAGTLIWNFVVE